MLSSMIKAVLVSCDTVEAEQANPPVIHFCTQLQVYTFGFQIAINSDVNDIHYEKDAVKTYLLQTGAPRATQVLASSWQKKMVTNPTIHIRKAAEKKFRIGWYSFIA
jgi:hypothetical protein